ncbi:hypothetical protein Pint_28094 [Pistacia integerrima]|uniref:Uncharacterized protein n=1 Tax=Pistacia integerrima TaxID=434235 RepID=A0ACC0YRG3_9ROSI|nr:hypothetical protein Pint_28094 [Pistacia integerrima]
MDRAFRETVKNMLQVQCSMLLKLWKEILTLFAPQPRVIVLEWAIPFTTKALIK